MRTTLQERVHGTPPPPTWGHGKLHRVLRVKKNFKNTGMKESNLLSLSYGRIVRKDIDTAEGLLPESFETYQIVEPGNIVMRLTDLQNDKRSLRQGLVHERGIITSAYDALKVGDDHDPRFWFYALLALDLAKYYYSLGGGVRQSINFADFPNDWIGVPDREHQTAIADFLDRETARIDQLIAKKERMIDKLIERSAALIASNVQEGGQLTKLAHHTKILPGYAFPSSDFSGDPTNIRLLRGVNVAPGNLRWDDVVYWPRNRTAEVSRFELKVGDVIMGMDRPWISSGIRVAQVAEADVPCFLLQRVCKIDPLSSLDKHYLFLLLNSRQFLAHFEPILTGVSVPHISSDQIQAFRFPYVPLEVQKQRVESCRGSLNRNQAVTEQIAASIERLHELRASLITSAVTGDLDIATWKKRGTMERHANAIEAGSPK